MKKIIFNKYFDSNWLSDIGAIVFCCLCIYIVFFTDTVLSYKIGFSVISLLFLAKIPFHQYKRRLYQIKIQKAPLWTAKPNSEIDFYKIFKLRIIRKDSKIGIKEKLFPCPLLDIKSINKKTDSIIILKSEWMNNNRKYGNYNTYYQVLYFNEKDALELICLKNSDVNKNDNSFDFENFIKLGENFAHILDLKYKVVTNL